MKYKRIAAAAMIAVMLCGCTSIDEREIDTTGTDIIEAMATVDVSRNEGIVTTALNSDKTETVSDSVAMSEVPYETAEQVVYGPDTEGFTERLNKIYTDYGITGMSVALFRD